MRELAKISTILARPDMTHPTYWRILARSRWWTLILLTRGRQGEPPEQPAPAPTRIRPEWLQKTGANLAGEDLLYLRIQERLHAHQQDVGPVFVATAAAIAASVAAELVRDGLDLRAA